MENKEYTKQELKDICSQINSSELNAKKAERESIKFKQVQYLLDKVGQIFKGTISGISDWGVYIELADSKCEGMVKSDNIDGNIEKEKFKVSLSNRDLFLGDSVMVKLDRVSLLKKEIDFLLI